MAANEMFDSAVRSSGDQAGVFEYDGETGYFYLYEIRESQGNKVVGAIRVLIGAPNFDDDDVSIRWDTAERMVGLFIRGKLWAAFDNISGARYGGHYGSAEQAAIPETLKEAFTMPSSE